MVIVGGKWKKDKNNVFPTRNEKEDRVSQGVNIQGKEMFALMDYYQEGEEEP